jgi:hypothetical protein
MVKRQFPKKSVEMMVIAQFIPVERKLALDQYSIEYREISEKRFRDIALEVDYVFQSEQDSVARIPETAVENDAASHETKVDVRREPNRTGVASSPDGKAELMAVVRAYDLSADSDLRVRRGSNEQYRQVVPPEWKTKYLHYEFYQTKSVIGAELHLNHPEVASIAEFLKPFDGRAVAGGAAKLTWDATWNSGTGRLAAFFPLNSSPEIVAAAMRDLIAMTRSGVSKYLTV